MKEKEFKERFKVGDKIALPHWIKGLFVVVDCIDFGISGNVKDHNLFIGTDQSNTTVTNFSKMHNWQPYKEEKPKDLEGVFEYFVVQKSSEYGAKMFPYLGDKKQFESTKKAYKKDEYSEVITLEEAKERGLKV